MAMTRSWANALLSPIDHSKVNAVADSVRDLARDVGERFEIEHDVDTGLHTDAFKEALVPTGIIAMWSGTLENIPSNWALCDGDDGRPNLLEKFIICVASGVDPGGTGGASTHTHGVGSFAGGSHTHTGPSHTHTVSGNTAACALTVAQIPHHSHNYKSFYRPAVTDWSNGVEDSVTRHAYRNYLLNTSSVTGGGVGHSHSVAINTGSGGTGATGGSAVTISGTSASGSNLPPYYALAFIIKE